MLRGKIASGVEPAFEYLGICVPIVEDKTLGQNSMTATGEAAELFFKAFLGVLNQRNM